LNLTTFESYVLSLYNNCEKFHCLPDSGSINEQRWDIMRLFDIMDKAKSDYYNNQRKNK